MDCGIPRPSLDAREEMIEEALRHIEEQPLLMPAVYQWHREIVRACT